MKQIKKYQLLNGEIPFDKWLRTLDKSRKARVLIRLERLKTGLYGNNRSLKMGIRELKFFDGERIYLYEENDLIIILLNGGNKQRQNNDIKKAELYLQDYKERFK